MQRKTLEHHVDYSVIFYVLHGVLWLFGNVWSYFSHPISQDLQAQQPGFSRPPKLTKACSGFLLQRRDRCTRTYQAQWWPRTAGAGERAKMDGWMGFFFFFLETKKWWNRKVEVNVCLKKGSCIWSFYCILYISIFMFLFANIYEVVVSNLTKMLDDFTPAKAGELPYWVDTTWVKNGLDRRGEAHVSTRLHRCLRASWWWKFVCHGKMYKGLYQWKSRFAAVVFLYILRI